MTTTTAACVRGCTLYRRHLTDCEDPDECRGCLPRRAEHGHLCHPCHRRLELMLTDADTVDRWLTGNMASTSAAPIRDDYERPGSHDLPDAIKAQVYDQRQVLRDFYASTVDELTEREDLHGPDQHGAKADAAYLLAWIGRVEYWPHIGDLWEYLAGEVSVAHGLAPWRPAARRISGVPCPGCAEVNLVIFGGESDVSCLSCRIIMTEDRFELWERVLKQEAS